MNEGEVPLLLRREESGTVCKGMHVRVKAGGRCVGPLMLYSYILTHHREAVRFLKCLYDAQTDGIDFDLYDTLNFKDLNLRLAE